MEVFEEERIGGLQIHSLQRICIYVCMPSNVSMANIDNLYAKPQIENTTHSFMSRLQGFLPPSQIHTNRKKAGENSDLSFTH